MRLLLFVVAVLFPHGGGFSFEEEPYACHGLEANWRKLRLTTTDFVQEGKPPGDNADLLFWAVSRQDCVLGVIAARLMVALVIPESREEMWASVEMEWDLVQRIPWPLVIRSSWPVFQLMRLHQRSQGIAHGDDADSGLQALADELEGRGELRGRSALVAALDLRGEQHQGSPGAVYLATAVVRLPVYDYHLEELVLRAQSLTGMSMDELIGAAGVLALLSVLGRAYFALLVDSGALYANEAESSAPDYTRHMMQAEDTPHFGRCVVPAATTPSGRCDPFALIAVGLRPWRRRGVERSDTLGAYKQVYDQKVFTLRITSGRLQLIVPKHSHYSVAGGSDSRGREPSCVASAVLRVLRKARLPSLEFVVNSGDLPAVRLVVDRPPFYNFQDRDRRVPVPLFSITGSRDFGDIVFPNVCRPALVNMSDDVRWEVKKEKAFWRGTDRGAVNWAADARAAFRDGSPRKVLVDEAMALDAEVVDARFLEDDLLNATVVNSDPNFVPMEHSTQWKYLIDLPGNGYSGSLKQKLTSSSAVLLPSKPLPPAAADASPVYEHYHAGLREFEHVMPFSSAKELIDRVAWSRSHDNEVKAIRDAANRYMETFEAIAECTIWRLLAGFADLVKYDVEEPTEFPESSMTEFGYLFPTVEEADRFEGGCRRMMERAAE